MLVKVVVPFMVIPAGGRLFLESTAPGSETEPFKPSGRATQLSWDSGLAPPSTMLWLPSIVTGGCSHKYHN